jgi:hypothetical protein
LLGHERPNALGCNPQRGVIPEAGKLRHEGFRILGAVCVDDVEHLFGDVWLERR